MLKEEFLARWKPQDNYYGSLFRKELNALVRAVREDCAKVALSQVWRGTPSDNLKKNLAARDIAAAIGGKGK